MKKMTRKVMEWGKKLHALKDEAFDLTGLDLESMRKWANQRSIRSYINNRESSNLIVYPVATKGIPCLILSSSLYPEVGILIFDAPVGSDAGSVRILGEYYASFKLACGCCDPEIQGIPEKEWRGKHLNFRKSFESAVRTACKRYGIKILFFECWDSDNPPEKPALKQDLDGLHLTRFNGDIGGYDKSRFAEAFCEIIVSASFGRIYFEGKV